MTVGELIGILQQAPTGANVLLEGCDCVGTAGGVEVNSKGLTVLVLRSDGTEREKLAGGCLLIRSDSP